MQWNRCAGLASALTLLVAVGCLNLNDVSNLSPYASRIGSTYRLTYAGEFDCELWPPRAPGADYVILPHLPQLEGTKKKGLKLKEGTLLKVEAARRGVKDEDYLLVTLDDPQKAGHRIRASIQPRFLEGWPDGEHAESAAVPAS
jgi:hypothetical protein